MVDNPRKEREFAQAKAALHDWAPPEDWLQLLLGCGVAAMVSFVCVKWLLRYVQSHTFNLFGWYRIGLGILILMLMRS